MRSRIGLLLLLAPHAAAVELALDRNHDGHVSRSERNDWRLVNLMSSPCDPKLAAQNMSDWMQSERWRVADEELRRERPKLMIHQHSCSPGMGAHLLPQLQALNATLQRRSGGRCRLALATVLRRPADMLESAIFFIATSIDLRPRASHAPVPHATSD